MSVDFYALMFDCCCRDVLCIVESSTIYVLILELDFLVSNWSLTLLWVGFSKFLMNELWLGSWPLEFWLLRSFLLKMEDLLLK